MLRAAVLMAALATCQGLSDGAIIIEQGGRLSIHGEAAAIIHEDRNAVAEAYAQCSTNLTKARRELAEESWHVKSNQELLDYCEHNVAQGFNDFVCGSDDECPSTLECLYRHEGTVQAAGSANPPGIDVPPYIDPSARICVSRATFAYNKVAYARKSNSNGCNLVNPCGVGGGECFTDDVCEGSLKCFKRHDGEDVPGVTIVAKTNSNHLITGTQPVWTIHRNTNLCYDPADGPPPEAETSITGQLIISAEGHLRLKDTTVLDVNEFAETAFPKQSDLDACLTDLAAMPEQMVPVVSQAAALGAELAACQAASDAAGIGKRPVVECASDADCPAVVPTCQKRTQGEPVPAVDLPVDAPADQNYCFSLDDARHMKIAVWMGNSKCKHNARCGVGGADCVNNAGCEGDLKCFMRDHGEDVPGVTILQKVCAMGGHASLVPRSAKAVCSGRAAAAAIADSWRLRCPRRWRALPACRKWARSSRGMWTSATTPTTNE